MIAVGGVVAGDEHVRARAAHVLDAHLLADRHQPVVEDLEGDGIDRRRAAGLFMPSLPWCSGVICVCAEIVDPGGCPECTTIVVPGCSITAGPAIATPGPAAPRHRRSAFDTMPRLVRAPGRRPRTRLGGFAHRSSSGPPASRPRRRRRRRNRRIRFRHPSAPSPARRAARIRLEAGRYLSYPLASMRAGAGTRTVWTWRR